MNYSSNQLIPWLGNVNDMSTMINTLSLHSFFTALRMSGLFQEHELLAWESRRSLPDDPQLIARLMVRDRALTTFQAERLLGGGEFSFRVGSYVILDQLGVGSKGTLYLAEHRAMQRRVALKLLNHDKVESRISLERFYREGRVAASLNHPNIVKLYDFAEEGDQPCLVMEHVEGRTLQEMLNTSGPLPVEKAVEYIRQAAAGLKHAHAKGVIHRDIKPSNLMLDKYGAIKILDMGHSRFMDDDGVNITKMYDPQSVVGTVEYVAPEQALGEQIDARCDIYSLGATLFTLIAGRPPFTGTAYQVLMAHQIEDPPLLTKFNPEVPIKLIPVVNKLLAKNPFNRYQTAGDVIQAIAPYADSQTNKCPATIPSASIINETLPVMELELAPVPRPSHPESTAGRPSHPGSKVSRHSHPLAKAKTAKAEKQPKPQFTPSALFAGIVLAALVVGVILYRLW